jgi:hypothetical protein
MYPYLSYLHGSHGQGPLRVTGSILSSLLFANKSTQTVPRILVQLLKIIKLS